MIHSYFILAQEVRNELGNIERVVDHTLQVWDRGQAAPADQDVYIEAIALNLQSFYTGLERIFQLIAERLDQELPSGEHWHTDLLARVSLDLPGLRPPVITTTTQNLLDDYRSFRHRIRNIYTYHIEPKKVEALVIKLPEMYASVRADMDRFLDFLNVANQTLIDDHN
jgi:hypothetical protein